MPAAQKKCTKCGEAKPATREFFSVKAKAKDGLNWHCKVCACAATVQWNKDNPERHRARSAAWIKAHTEHVKAYKAEYRAENRERFAQYRADNRDRTLDYFKAKSAAWRESNPERAKEAGANWRKNNPEKVAAIANNRRARKKGNGGTHTGEDIQAQYDRQKGKCFYCRMKVGEDYHVEHFVPLVKGGSNGPENIVISCPTCNWKKGSKHPMDFCGRLL